MGSETIEPRLRPKKTRTKTAKAVMKKRVIVTVSGATKTRENKMAVVMMTLRVSNLVSNEKDSQSLNIKRKM